MTGNNKKLRIGIPRALFYYSYFPFCNKFFTLLESEVIVSQRTNKQLLQSGLRASTNELCLPLKLLYGHVIDLKDRVDYIFLPYIISTKEGTYFCPKLIGSPDIIKANIEGIRLLSFDVDMDNYYSSLLSSLKEVARKLSINPLKVYSAFKQAKAHQERFNSLIAKGMMFDEALEAIENQEQEMREKEKSEAKQKTKNSSLCIAIIGHNYVFYDTYISFDIIQKLRERGIVVVSSDRLSDMQIDKSLKDLEKKPHWSIGSRILGSTIHYSMLESVDGIIYITPFGCSSDSLIKEYIDSNIPKKKPFMTVTIDEHSADAGIITRLEAFIDMLERKQRSRAKKHTDPQINRILTELSED